MTDQPTPDPWFDEAYLEEVCKLVYDTSRGAVVVASPSSFERGGHITIVHNLSTGPAIEAALASNGLFVQRLSNDRIAVYREEPS